jgi:sec-independent protein translocase protein TatA
MMDTEVPFHGGEKMGPLGVPETIFIFILALLLFGPKKLPELGRTFGKAMMEFRRASNELKQTFDREMQQIERETAPIKEEAQKYTNELYNYDSYYDSGAYGSESYDHSTANDPSHVGAAAVQAADSTVSTTSNGTENAAIHTQPEPSLHGEPAQAAENGAGPTDGHANPQQDTPVVKS